MPGGLRIYPKAMEWLNLVNPGLKIPEGLCPGGKGYLSLGGVAELNQFLIA